MSDLGDRQGCAHQRGLNDVYVLLAHHFQSKHPGARPTLSGTSLVDVFLTKGAAVDRAIAELAAVHPGASTSLVDEGQVIRVFCRQVIKVLTFSIRPKPVIQTALLESA